MLRYVEADVLNRELSHHNVLLGTKAFEGANTYYWLPQMQSLNHVAFWNRQMITCLEAPVPSSSIEMPFVVSHEKNLFENRVSDDVPLQALRRQTFTAKKDGAIQLGRDRRSAAEFILNHSIMGQDSEGQTPWSTKDMLKCILPDSAIDYFLGHDIDHLCVSGVKGVLWRVWHDASFIVYISSNGYLVWTFEV